MSKKRIYFIPLVGTGVKWKHRKNFDKHFRIGPWVGRKLFWCPWLTVMYGTKW